MLARGAADGLARARGPEAPPWLVSPGAVATGTLAGFPEGVVRCSPDMLASVVLPLRRAPALTGVLALEPQEALHLVRDRLGEGPWPTREALGAVRELGEAVLRGAFAALLGSGTGAAPPGAARLEEDALAATLLRTHAPREAALLSAELWIAGETTALRAVVLALAEAKGLASLLALAEPGAAPGAAPAGPAGS